MPAFTADVPQNQRSPRRRAASTHVFGHAHARLDEYFEDHHQKEHFQTRRKRQIAHVARNGHQQSQRQQLEFEQLPAT